MNNECMARLAEQWEQICQNYSSDDLLHAFHFIQDHSLILVEEFYKNMLIEKESAEFFSDDLIQQRLRDTLNAWLLESFSVGINKRYADAVQKQAMVGHVHARVGIPSWLIMRGVREIERKMFELLDENPHHSMLTTCSYIVQIMGFATEVMCRSYEAKTAMNQEIKHSYRVFSAMQDVAVQKDKQRSSLLDWENELMFKVFSEHEKLNHPMLSKSEFGLWFIHKASYAFTGSDQVDLIIERIYQVDELNQEIMDCTDKNNMLGLIQQIRDLNREIQLLVDQLFQVAEYIESGNDSLTQLLNRRYLNTIISREITFSRKNHTPLSLLAIDADYFKSINDKFGHAAGDLALKFLAEALQKYSQGSDYAFRVGGEEFLLLLVDTDEKRALNIAESIRKYIENGMINSAQGQQFKFTVSIGRVLYDGHPDYQRFLNAADSALYMAKNNGRNRVYMAHQSLNPVAQPLSV
ncbi:diguanylate cyclase [Acinetobacter lwoffii]|uniref:diguanylate cyclase n=1 Tax=Acinetobacter lwoffii TaxID=28090 RepID=UPI0012987033|nr:diguanylate cyclase [Acinetobacter lwoffii]MRA03405.1 diguanylate cyclase [Acinetobacter lwoffii]